MRLSSTGSYSLKWRAVQGDCMAKLELKNVNVYIGSRQILKSICMSVNGGELHVVMGPNGSGKTTFAHALLGLPQCRVEGDIIFDGKRINELKIDERARLGLFIAFQFPAEIEGVRNANLVRQARLSRDLNEPAAEFKADFEDALERAGLSKQFYSRDVNKQFSGGEKKKNELAQLIMLSPKIAVLDEIDSGLDVDSIKKTASLISSLVKSGMGIILITHSTAIIKYLNPAMFYVFNDGSIIMKGGRSMAGEVMKKGFASL